MMNEKILKEKLNVVSIAELVVSSGNEVARAVWNSSAWRRLVLLARRAWALGVRLLSGRMLGWICVASLLTGILFWRITPDIETVFPRIVCAGACLGAILAARNAGYVWLTAFGGIAVIFNPVVPDTVSRIAFSGLYCVCAATGLLCLAVSKTGPPKPTLSLLAQRKVALDCRAARRASI